MASRPGRVISATFMARPSDGKRLSRRRSTIGSRDHAHGMEAQEQLLVTGLDETHPGVASGLSDHFGFPAS
jgi:hypothetical protein